MCICVFTNKTSFLTEKHTIDGCEGEKISARLKTVSYVCMCICVQANKITALLLQREIVLGVTYGL
jgi:hypothetical protein